MLPGLQGISASLENGVRLWLDVTTFAEERSKSDLAFVGAVAVDYLLLSGYVSVGYMLARSACVAQSHLESSSSERAFYRAKVHTAQFYFDKLLPRIHLHAHCIRSGSASLMSMQSDEFEC
jgi:hypothetical protein